VLLCVFTGLRRAIPDRRRHDVLLGSRAKARSSRRRPQVRGRQGSVRGSLHLRDRGEAASKAKARNLGDYIAELEVPDETPMSVRGGHRGLIGTTPGQLLGVVRNVQGVDEV
jgi:hypothetical protein